MDVNKTYTAEEIAALSTEELAELNTALETAWKDGLAAANAEPTAENVAAVRTVGQTRDLVDADNTRRSTEAAELAAELEALSERQFGEEAQVEVEEPAAEAGTEEIVEAEVVEEPTAEVVTEPVAAAVRAPATTKPAGTANQRVAARGGVKALAAKTSKPSAPASTRAPVSITAAAGQNDRVAGEVLNMEQVGESVIERARSFSTPDGNGQSVDLHRFPTAKFAIDFDPELMVDSMEEKATEQINFAIDESRLPGGSLIESAGLTASGGWCAPSETDYTLEQDATAEGMYSIPEVGIRRGGLRYPVSPDFAAFYANPGFIQNETQAIAGTTKPCVEVSCPGFTDVRLDVEGLCIKVPILTNVGYPEAVANFVAGTMVAHQHWINANVIGRVQALSGSKRTITGLGAVTTDTLEAFGLVIDQRRQKHRLALKATMEVVLPFWVQNVFRADIARRAGRGTASVSDAEIRAHFTVLGANVQYVYDWQGLNEAALVYPGAFQALIYPAGTFVKGTQPVITLDTVYDAASLAVNTYTGLFTEQAFLVAKKKLGADYVEVPICTAGRQGALNLTCA